jgi:hypothetical protein
MSISDDICSAIYSKESRMLRARQFIGEWLVEPQLQFISGHSLNSLTSLANSWIQRTGIHSNQSYPIVSSKDIKEAAFEVLGSEEISRHEHEELDNLEALVRNDRVRY